MDVSGAGIHGFHLKARQWHDFFVLSKRPAWISLILLAMAADFFLFCSSLASLNSWRTCCRVDGAQLQWREVHPKIIADSKHSITQYWRYDYLISMTSPEVLQPSFVPIGPCLKSPPLCFFRPLPPLQEFLLSQLLQLNAKHRNVPAAKLMRHTGYLAAIVVHDVNFHLCI